MDWVDKPQNYKDLYGILQLLRFSHLNNFQLKTLKLGWVAFHSVTFQLKCLDFQSNQYKKLVPVLSRFCNGLLQFPPSISVESLIVLKCNMARFHWASQVAMDTYIHRTTTGPPSVKNIIVTGKIKGFFLGSKFSIPGFFRVRTFWQVFMWVA